MSHLFNLPKIHPRAAIATKAGCELESFLADWTQRHTLTATEELMILNNAIGRTLKYCLRSERHPKQPSKGADEL